MQNLSQMTEVIDPLATAAKSEPEKIGHRVCIQCVVPLERRMQGREDTCSYVKAQ